MKTSPTMTTAEVAIRLSVSAHVVRELLQKGRIPGVKLSDSAKAKWRIDRKDLEKWIQQEKAKNKRGRK